MRKVFLAGIVAWACAAATWADGPLPVAPPEPTVTRLINPNNGHAYMIVPGNDPTKTEAAAVALGGHLATIRNAAELNWLKRYLGAAYEARGATTFLATGYLWDAERKTYAWRSGEKTDPSILPPNPPQKGWLELHLPDATLNFWSGEEDGTHITSAALVEIPLASADPADMKTVDALVAQLNDDRFDLREEATKKLKTFGPKTVLAIRAALQQKREPESEARLRDVQQALAWTVMLRDTESLVEYGQRVGMPVKRSLPLGKPGVGELQLTLIPPGMFVMGSPATEAMRGDEPQHLVQITKPFYLGSGAVTQTQWKDVMGTEPSGFKGANLPVEMVSWKDAVAFCDALTKRDAGKGNHTYRLPTEAEWEYACRAGSTTVFNFGDAIDGSKANFNGNMPYPGSNGPVEFRVQTTVVGTFPPNAWGLFDMHGNVWQWCADARRAYQAPEPIDMQVDPLASGDTNAKVLRGGSWCDLPWFARSASREWSPDDRKTIHIGFRVVEE